MDTVKVFAKTPPLQISFEALVGLKTLQGTGDLIFRPENRS